MFSPYYDDNNNDSNDRNNDDDNDDVDIADDTEVSFLSLFNSPLEKCLKSDNSREPLRCPAPCFWCHVLSVLGNGARF